MIGFSFSAPKIILKHFFFCKTHNGLLCITYKEYTKGSKVQGVTALWSVYDVCHDMFGSLKMISFIIDAELNQED